MDEEHVAAHRAVRADDRLAAEDGRPRVDRDVALDGRMPLGSSQFLDACGGLRPEGDAVINLHVIPDAGRLAHDCPGAVVDEKVRADLGPGMEVDAGATVCPFAHDARDQRHAQPVELVRHPLHRDRLDERIRHDDLLVADGGGVAGVGGLDIGPEPLADGGKAAEELGGEFAGHLPRLGRLAAGRLVLDALGNLILQPAADAVHQHGNLHLQLGGLDRFLVKKTGQQQSQQVGRDCRDGELGRQIAAVQVVDAAHLGVGGDQAVGQLCDACAHGRSIGQSAKMARSGRLRPEPAVSCAPRRWPSRVENTFTD